MTEITAAWSKMDASRSSAGNPALCERICSKLTAAFPARANSGHTSATGSPSAMPDRSSRCKRQAEDSPLVADQKGTRVSRHQARVSSLSQNPAASERTSSPQCHTETEAPSSSRLAKLSLKTSSTRASDGDDAGLFIALREAFYSAPCRAARSGSLRATSTRLLSISKDFCRQLRAVSTSPIAAW